MKTLRKLGGSSSTAFSMALRISGDCLLGGRLGCGEGPDICRKNFRHLANIEVERRRLNRASASFETIRASQVARLDPPLKPSRWVKALT